MVSKPFLCVLLHYYSTGGGKILFLNIFVSVRPDRQHETAQFLTQIQTVSFYSGFHLVVLLAFYWLFVSPLL